MSKVYDYHMEMEELAQDSGWQEWQEKLEAEAQEEHYGYDNMEDNKAKEFARMIGEE